MNELKDYLNSNRERTITTTTIDLNNLVDIAIKYLDYISKLVEQKSGRKLVAPNEWNINTEDTTNPRIYLEWSNRNPTLTMEISDDYDFVRYEYWDSYKTPDWCHNDHRIGTELDAHVLDTLLLFTEDK